MVIVTYDFQGVIVCHFVPCGRIVTAHYYKDLPVHQVQRGVRDKRPNLVDSAIILQDHMKQSVYGSYCNVGYGKNWSTHCTLPTFYPMTLISFPRLRNHYVIGGLQHNRTLLMLCANRWSDSRMNGQMLRLMVFSASYIVGSIWRQ